jgi:type I restriction enzyme, S subunit
MRHLPSGWTQCKVEELFDSFSGGTPSKSKPEYWSGDIPWVSSGGFNSDVINEGSEFITAAGLENSSAKLCRPGSVIVVVRSGILKHTLPVALSGRQLAINQDIKAFDSGNDDLNRWLFLSLKNSAKEILGLNREGTTVQSVKYESLKEHQLAIPPLNEQRSILTALDKLLSRVNSAQERLATIPRILKRFRQSVLTAACSGHLTTDWRGYSLDLSRSIPPISIGPPEHDDSTLGWRWRLLIDLARLESGHTPRKTKPEYWTGGKVPWICLQDIREAHGKVLVDTKLMPTELGISNSSARMLPPGTVVFSRDISVGYVTIMGRKMATSQHFANWLCGSEINNRYLMYALMASKDSLISSGQGSTVRTIYMPALESMHIRLPKIEEQLEIVRRVHSLFKTADALEARYRNANAHVNKLSQSILAKAFHGELVPQDPHDEPASVLLERVLQQRNGSSVTKVRSNTKRSGR